MLNQDINFVMNQTQKNTSNSAYVRIKIFKKPIVAKMLINSGNLVSDLISEEFAKSLCVKSKPIQKTVGTAAKGGSVEIIGQSEPIKIFLENLPRPVVIRPYIVRNLSHPINVGRDFLGRYKGKLEYSPTAGFLEIQGAKTKLILKKDLLESELVTDSRLRKLFAGAKLKHGEMVYDGSLNVMEDKLNRDRFSVEVKEANEIPGHSAKFVKMTTNGQLPVRIARGKTLMLEVKENDTLPVVIMPGLYRVIDNEAYCLVINPEMERKKLDKGVEIGEILLKEDDKTLKLTGLYPLHKAKRTQKIWKNTLRRS
jgi:hypothetical protein